MRESEEGAWKTVDRRRSKVGQRKESNADELRKIVTTFFVSNLPLGWDSRRLWKQFAGKGRLVDAFIPVKKDLSGGSFGFVKFMKVSNVVAMLKDFNEMEIEGKRIRVNVARHDRPKVNESRHDRRSYGVKNTGERRHERRSYEVKNTGERMVTGKSFKEVLQDRNDQTVGRKDEEKLAELVISDMTILKEHSWLESCLVGELRSIELLAIADCFLKNQRINWSVWFGGLSLWNNSFRLDSRAVWLKIRGVPVNCWDPVVFNLIAEQFGRVLIPFECSEDARHMSYGKICVLRSFLEFLEPCRINVKWKDVKFMAFVMEDGDWKPPVEAVELQSDSDYESEQGFEEGELLEMAEEGVVQLDLQPEVGDGAGTENTRGGSHASLGNEKRNCCEDFDGSHVQMDTEVREAQGDIDFVEDTLMFGGPQLGILEETSSSGPVDANGPGFLNHNNLDLNIGPVDVARLPDLNTPAEGIDRTHLSKSSHASVQEKGGKKRINTVRFKDVIINANLRKKKGGTRDKEKLKAIRRMGGLEADS
ncbi:hypothetical protein LXL04_031641 [Taraxacum kok-saghyz]